MLQTGRLSESRKMPQHKRHHPIYCDKNKSSRFALKCFVLSYSLLKLIWRYCSFIANMVTSVLDSVSKSSSVRVRGMIHFMTENLERCHDTTCCDKTAFVRDISAFGNIISSGIFRLFSAMTLTLLSY